MGLLWLLAAQAAMAAATPPPRPIIDNGPACSQIAARLPMQPPTAKRATWRYDPRGGLKIFKGDVSTTFGAGPVDENDAKQWQRAEKMCEKTAKGGECEIDGPVVFGVAYDDVELEWMVKEGSRFRFQVNGSIIECEDLKLGTDKEDGANGR